jgi:hypothetical protein
VSIVPGNGERLSGDELADTGEGEVPEAGHRLPPVEGTRVENADVIHHKGALFQIELDSAGKWARLYYQLMRHCRLISLHEGPGTFVGWPLFGVFYLFNLTMDMYDELLAPLWGILFI